MKYIKYLFLIFVFSLFVPTLYAEDYSFHIDTDTKEVGSGSIIEVKLYVDSIIEDTEGIDYFNTGIAFDNKVFELANDSSDFDLKESWIVGNLKKLKEGVFFYVSSSKDA